MVELVAAADVATLWPVAERTLLVLVNPFSGPGTALRTFQRHVVPLLAEAGLHYQLVVTGRSSSCALLFCLPACGVFLTDSSVATNLHYSVISLSMENSGNFFLVLCGQPGCDDRTVVSRGHDDHIAVDRLLVP